MVLKEAFTYQNYLTDTIQKAQCYITRSSIVTKITEKHHRSKADPNAKDETIEVKSDFDFTPKQVVDLIVSLIDEKERLQKAIASTKTSLSFDIDSALSANAVKQNFISALNVMNGHKSTESKNYGTGYKLDVEGKQTSYKYEIDSVTTINFDRNEITGLIKRLTRECTATSTAIDRAMVTAELIDFVPQFDGIDTVEELLSK